MVILNFSPIIFSFLVIYMFTFFLLAWFLLVVVERSQTSKLCSFMNKLNFSLFSSRERDHSLIDDRGECWTLLSDAEVAQREASSLSWGMRRICKLTKVDNWFEHFKVIVCWSLRCVLVCNLNYYFQ